MTDKIIRTFKYRIYPTKRQISLLEMNLALCCELYNAALQERRDAWKIEHKSISFFDQNKQLTEIKIECPELRSVGCRALEDALKRVDRAFAGFFVRVRHKQ